MTLNQKQLKSFAKIFETAGRLNELNRLEAYVPSSVVSARKRTLKAELRKLSNSEPEEEKIHVRININNEETKAEKKEKSFISTIKDLLNIKKDDDDDDDVVAVLESLMPAREGNVTVGKIVREL